MKFMKTQPTTIAPSAHWLSISLRCLPLALLGLFCWQGAVHGSGGSSGSSGNSGSGNSGGGNFNEGELIVALKPGVDVNAFNARHATTVKESLEGVNQYLLSLPGGVKVQDKLREIMGDSETAFALPNAKFQPAEVRQRSQAFLDQRSQAFLDGASPLDFYGQPSMARLHLVEAQQWSRGGGVRVAVIDTGLDFEHPLFAGRIAYPNFDFVDNDNAPDEVMGGTGSGHGTFVAGLISLTAPGATIMPLRAFGPDGAGTSFNIAKAIRYAADNGAQIINMSFGLLERDKLIDDALGYASGKVYMISAAGNDDQNFLHFPAQIKDKTLAVTSTDDGDHKAVWANFNRDVQVAAPGVELYSAYPGNRWATWSGTSFSTALVTGEAALALALNPGLNQSAMTDVLTHSGTNLDALNPNYARMLGSVRIDFQAAVQLAFPH